MTGIIKKLSDLNAQIGFVVLTAPDGFPNDWPFGLNQGENLLIAFKILHEGMPFVKKKIKDDTLMAKLEEILTDSLVAYQAGEKKKGAHLLQDFQDIVFPGRFAEYESRKGE